MKGDLLSTQGKRQGTDEYSTNEMDFEWFVNRNEFNEVETRNQTGEFNWKVVHNATKQIMLFDSFKVKQTNLSISSVREGQRDVKNVTVTTKNRVQGTNFSSLDNIVLRRVETEKRSTDAASWQGSSNNWNNADWKHFCGKGWRNNNDGGIQPFKSKHEYDETLVIRDNEDSDFPVWISHYIWQTHAHHNQIWFTKLNRNCLHQLILPWKRLCCHLL